MKRTSFRTARTRSPMSVRKIGTGLLIMGMALSASAKDSAAVAPDSGKNQSPNAQANPAKIGHKPRRWLQVGMASWYGSHFQGRTTAAGERFDMNLMTCAHPTLPMGTWLRVTNLRNRRTAYVRVNDRGPVLEGRIVDLSYAAARTLGLAGLGKVKLETVHDGDPNLAKALMAQLQMPDIFDPLAR
jgi:rare lipoprotein A